MNGPIGMLWRVLRTIVLASLCAGLVSAQGRRVALVIGNAAYSFAPLQNPVNDAQDISTELTNAGFTVQTTVNASLGQLEQAVETFILGLKPDDTALFYYSGHGMQIDGENYIVPIGFAAHDEIDAKYSSFAVSRILDRMINRRVRLSMLILDACRDNPFQLTRSNLRGWAPINGAAGTFIAFATAPGSTASDNTASRNGLFTTYVIQGMRTPDLGLDELFRNVREQVYKDSQGKQLPWTSSSVLGHFAFHAGPTPAPTAAAIQAPAGPVNVVAEMSRSIQANNRTPAVFKVRATAYLTLGQVQAAKDDFTQAIALNDQYPEAYRGRGQAFLLLGDFAPAIADFSKAIQLNPSDYIALYYRSLAYTLTGENDQALADATAAIRLKPEFSEAYLSRSCTYYGMGRFSEATADSERALKLKPSARLAYVVRGQSRSAMGDASGAASDYQRAIELTRSTKPQGVK